jgi:thioredoxin reductase
MSPSLSGQIVRADRAGGAWDFDPRPDRDPPFPNLRPLAPDWGELEDLRRECLNPESAALIFAPPGPVDANMKSRGSEEIMCTSLKDWPEGTKAPIDHDGVADYLRDIARIHQVEEKIRFRTRVEKVSKTEGEGRWHIQSSRLITQTGSYALEHESWKFDSVFVATGRYGAPRVPDVPGLPSWKSRFPQRVIHSKQYRTPTLYYGKTVLVIGAFISALEITNELVDNGAKVYESGRDTKVDFRDKMKHGNAEKVPMVASFILDTDNQDGSTPRPHVLDDDSPIPGQAVLENGRVLEGIDHVIISTGYLTAFPFLGPHLEQPFTAPQDADEKVVTTADARTVHNLHEDIFYLPDPTLAFVGVSHFASTFSLYDFQAQVLAAVLAGQVQLPSKTSMKQM